MAQLVKCLSSMREAIQSPAPHKNSVVACNPSSWEVETAESEVQCYPGLCSVLEASLGYMTYSIKYYSCTSVPSYGSLMFLWYIMFHRMHTA